MMQQLLNKGAKVNAYDPIALEKARSLQNNANITYHTNAIEALNGANALIIATEWKEFNAPNFDEIALKLKSPVIFDGRNMYDPRVMQENGIIYYPFGREQPNFSEAGLVPSLKREEGEKLSNFLANA
jgi:UDPglucose 6-dehydrogenase